MITIIQDTVRNLREYPNANYVLDMYARESSIEGLPNPVVKMDTYLYLDNQGAITCYGAYNFNDLVGFLILLKSELPHYSIPVGIVESFFVLPEYRSTGAGIKLLANAESEARDKRYSGLLISAPEGGQLEKYLNNLKDYKPTNTIFFKSFL